MSGTRTRVLYINLDTDFLPISGFTGANMKDKLSTDVCNWYNGVPLITLLDNIEIGRKYDGPLMMPISDKFKDMGTIVTGKIESGSVKKGQTVLLMPNKKTAEVLSIFMEELEILGARSGDNIRLRLKNVEEEDVTSGSVLCFPSNPIHTVSSFEAQLVIMEHKSIICGGYTAVMHAHNCVEEITLTDLLFQIEKKTMKKSKHPPMFVKQGDICIARIECSQMICLETFEDHPQLGRFTIRDEGRTVAIGKVTKLILE